MTPDDIFKLKLNLPKGWAANLAIKFDKSEDYIRKVINNDRDNVLILQSAIQLAAENKLVKLERSEQMKFSLASL